MSEQVERLEQENSVTVFSRWLAVIDWSSHAAQRLKDELSGVQKEFDDLTSYCMTCEQRVAFVAAQWLRFQASHGLPSLDLPTESTDK